MEPNSPPDEKKEELYLNNYMKKELKSSANWGMFLSISMLAFFGLYLISILDSVPRFATGGGAIGSISLLLLIAFIGLLLGMGIVLFLFSNNLKKAMNQNRSAFLVDSFESLSRYFILAFFILIVILIFSLLLFIY